MKELHIQQQILLECHKYDLTLFRNNTGMLYNRKGTPVKYGLAKGSSDLIGWHNKTGQFVAIEVKMPGRKATKEQQSFIDAVKRAGGIAFVAHSVDCLTQCSEFATM